jgi:ATP-dependent exoDNAse (exonuclease V) beta subunit
MEREESAARGIAVHELLEWSSRNGWREPSTAGELLEPVRAWLESGFFAEQVRDVPTRAEVPLLVEVAGTVLRGSIDLLVERPGCPPLVVDYKTDRLGDSSPVERAAHYSIQRDIYAFAVAEARGATEVEIAYVFLERPDEPAVELLDQAAIASGRERIAQAIERIASGEPAA